MSLITFSKVSYSRFSTYVLLQCKMVAIEPDVVAIDGERTTEHTQSTTESGNALEGSTAVPSTEPNDEKPTPAPVLVPSTPTQCLTGQGVPSLPVASGSTQSAQGSCDAQKRCEQKNEEASLTQMAAVPSISKCPPTQGVPPALPLSDSAKHEASAAHSVSVRTRCRGWVHATWSTIWEVPDFFLTCQQFTLKSYSAIFILVILHYWSLCCFM